MSINIYTIYYITISMLLVNNYWKKSVQNKTGSRPVQKSDPSFYKLRVRIRPKHLDSDPQFGYTRCYIKKLRLGFWISLLRCLKVRYEVNIKKIPVFSMFRKYSPFVYNDFTKKIDIIQFWFNWPKECWWKRNLGRLCPDIMPLYTIYHKIETGFED